MTVQLRAAFRTHVGMVRERNEDSCFVGRGVFAVADGLGGHRAGEVASTLALEAVVALDQMDVRDAAKRVVEAVRRGNRAVFERAQGDAELKGMGTTMTALVVHNGSAHLAHVGDSRCYLIRGEEITQLSNDHTLVARMVDEGRLTPEQAEAHPQRSILTRALGAERDIDVDEVTVSLASGDRLLLCSDGLTGVIGDDELRAMASSGSDLDEICESLIAEANARGGPDNITAVLVDVGGTLPPPARVRRIPFPAGKRTLVRALVWVALIAVLLLGSLFGVRAWANRSFFVGASGDRVTIYRGIPVDVVGFELFRVEEPTDLRVGDLPAPFQRSVREGIREGTLEEARRRVEELRRSTGGTPLPSPSPTPKGSP